MNEHKNNRNWIFWLIIIAVFVYGICVLRSVLLPFVVGIVIGYLLDPMVGRLVKMHINRTVATLLTLLSVVIVLVPTFIFVVSFAQEEFMLLINNAPEYVAILSEKIEPILVKLQNNFPDLQAEKFKEYLSNNMAGMVKFIGKVAQEIITNGFAFINLLSLLLISPVVTFYMLRDWPDFVKKVENLLPKKSKKSIKEQFFEIDRAISGFIRGQLSVCVILGAFYSIGLFFVGLKGGIFVGFLAGIISFIPYIGSISGFLVSICLAFAQFNEWSSITAVIVVFFVGQFLEGNFLTPKLVGDSVGLHPVWIMFALLSGGVLLGFLGLMLAVPCAAVISVLLRHAIANYKKSNLYLEN